MKKLQNLHKEHKHICVCTIVFLLIVLFFIQPKIFNLFFQTFFGRCFLVLLIVYITYCHQIWGILFVLFLVIMYNNPLGMNDGSYQAYNAYQYGNGYSYLEGFDVSGNRQDLSGNIQDNSGNFQDNSGNFTSVSGNSQNDGSGNTMAHIAMAKKMQGNNNTNSNNTNSNNNNNDKNKNNKSLEGFDMLGLENNMKRGKQSNSIPVNHGMRKSENVMPYEPSMSDPFAK